MAQSKTKRGPGTNDTIFCNILCHNFYRTYFLASGITLVSN